MITGIVVFVPVEPVVVVAVEPVVPVVVAVVPVVVPDAAKETESWQLPA